MSLPGPVPVIPPTFQSVRVSNKCLKCRKAMSALQKAENLDCIALGYLKPNLCDCVSFCLSVMSYITSSLKSNTHIHTLHESDRACMSCLKYLAAVCSIWSASCQRGLACLSFSVFFDRLVGAGGVVPVKMHSSSWFCSFSNKYVARFTFLYFAGKTQLYHIIKMMQYNKFCIVWLYWPRLASSDSICMKTLCLSQHEKSS